MKEKKHAKLLRIFISESINVDHTPVYEKIVLEAKKESLAGATVYKGIMGYGGRDQIHTSKILSLSDDLPLVIEIVDSLENIEEFLPIIDEIFEKGKVEGLITIENAEIIKYTVGKYS